MRPLLALLSMVFLVGCATAELGERLDVGPFEVSTDAMSLAEMTIAQAQEEGKLALIVLGGNWCHDSKSLAKRLQSQDLTPVIEEAYVMRLISVGFLDNPGADDIAAKYTTEGAYLATPTVLILDPKTGEMVNRDDHLRFRDSASLSDEEVKDYFVKFTDAANWSVLPTFKTAAEENVYTQRLQAIDEDFRAPNVVRLQEANSVLGPMLKTRDPDLNAYWKPVREFRYGFGDELLRLRREVAEQQAAGTTQFSELPTYAPFPWAHSEGDLAEE